MNKEMLKEIEERYQNNEFCEIVSSLNVYFREYGYDEVLLDYCINCFIKLGLLELAIKSLKLHLKLFPKFYTPLTLAKIYIDLNMIKEFESILNKNKFNSKVIFSLAKKCYFNNHHELSKKLFNKFLKMCDEPISVKRAKEYLRKIDIYEEDKNVFVETSYSHLLSEGKDLESKQIIYTSKIRDEYFENSIDEDPKKATRPYMIWKIDEDKLYCFAVTTRITHKDGKIRGHILLSENYKVNSLNRVVKNNLVVIQKNDVESVIDKVHDEDFEVIIKRIYGEVCFFEGKFLEASKFFIDIMSSEFNPEIYDIIKIPFKDDLENICPKTYFIVEIDIENHLYIGIEVSLYKGKIKIVDYNLHFINMNTPIFSVKKVREEREKELILERVKINS